MIIATTLLAIAPLIPILFLLGGGGLIAWFAVKKKDPNAPPPPKRLPRPKVPPVVAPAPYKIVTSADGTVRLQITNAFGLYSWAVKTATENGATAASNGEDVLRSLAKSLSGAGTGITEVEVVEKPDVMIAQWTDILADAAPLTWDQVQTSVTAWLTEKGLA
jgi:hypothetical protein